jgi:thiamine-monophosphate kinase
METGRVGAMMDISDGIASDLRHILKASGVGAVVALDKIPCSPQLRSVCAEQDWDIYELATGGGGDFELLLTGPEGLERSVDFPLHAVGRIVAGDDLVWTVDDEPVDLNFEGYKHF